MASLPVVEHFQRYRKGIFAHGFQAGIPWATHFQEGMPWRVLLLVYKGPGFIDYIFAIDSDPIGMPWSVECAATAQIPPKTG
jgi:hypothetical protein